eukprot:scaffold44546_cov46-Cyclotella_meneghiniana.AAC.8
MTLTLLEKTNDPQTAKGLLEAMHCNTIPKDEDENIEYKMVSIGNRYDWWYNVTYDPNQAQKKACKGLVNVEWPTEHYHLVHQGICWCHRYSHH